MEARRADGSYSIHFGIAASLAPESLTACCRTNSILQNRRNSEASSDELSWPDGLIGPSPLFQGR